MPVRLDDLDLNSDFVPVERSDEFHGVDGSADKTLSDRMGGVDKGLGLGFVGSGKSAEIEMELVDWANSAKAVDMPTGGEIPANHGGSFSGLSHGRTEPDLTKGFEFSDQQLDGCLNFVSSDTDWWTGGWVEIEGTEVRSDIDELVNLIDDRFAHDNGFGSNENQGVVNKELTKDIEQPQDIKKINVEQDVLQLDTRGKKCQPGKEGHFYVSDLVWGKVRGHPWWPGQIFDIGDTSQKARRYFKKDTFLIAYFGDNTFAWNEASQIKPFREHFSRMERQSNLDTFCDAVNCALEEVSRRVEFELSCPCLPKVVYDRIKTQIIVNGGIREESSRRVGGDEHSSAASFKPANLVHYLKALAQSPHGRTDRLERITAQAQVVAFKRWKGSNQLPEFKMLGGLLEEDANSPATRESKYSKGLNKGATSVPKGNGKFLGEGKLVIHDNSSRKRKEISCDGVSPSKKETHVSDSTARSHLNLSTGMSGPEGKDVRNLTSPSVKKPNTGVSVPDGLKEKNRKTFPSPMTAKKFPSVRDSMCRALSQSAVSTPFLKDGSKKTAGVNGRNKRPSSTSSEKPQRKKAIPVVSPPPDEMLSQLFMAGKDPLNGCNILLSSVNFFSDFRNSFCLENTTEGSDRTVQIGTEEQVLLEPEFPNEKRTHIVNPGADVVSGPKLDSKQHTAVVNSELEGKAESQLDEKFKEEHTATALIMKFSNLESIPPKSRLNEIFKGYGPLYEAETKVLKKSKCAKMIFKRRSDAEMAFSSSGKYSIFGPSLTSYCLHYSPTLRKTSTSATERSRKDASSVEGNAA